MSVMTDAQVLSNLRERVGAPSVDTISDRKLTEYINSALHWIADELEYRVVTTNNALTLVAGTYRYTLPTDCLRVFWAEWNGARLEPASLDIWARDGLNFRTASNGTPAQFAVDAEEIIIYPPPSSTAITSDGYIDLCYVGTAESLQTDGQDGLTDTDMWVVIYKAACEYLGTHPTQENLLRIQHCDRELSARMPAARRRHMDNIRTQHGGFKVYSSRYGGAR